MEKNIPLSANANLAATVLSVINILKAPFFMLRDYYSGIIGKKLSNGSNIYKSCKVVFIYFLIVMDKEKTAGRRWMLRYAEKKTKL